MLVRMKFLSDTILGSGKSVPGAEDITLLLDRQGFPYLKGSTFKGILREEAENYAVWLNKSEKWLDSIFGKGGDSYKDCQGKIEVTDFCIPLEVRETVLKETSDVTDLFSSFRTFTQLENGIAKDTSLRIARCMNKGLVFYGEVKCDSENEAVLKEILPNIMWIGNMRTRGFGHVEVKVIE